MPGPAMCRSYWGPAAHRASDVRARAWPESPGLGPAWRGFGLTKLEAKPTQWAWAWPGLAWAQARASVPLHQCQDHFGPGWAQAMGLGLAKPQAGPKALPGPTVGPGLARPEGARLGPALGLRPKPVHH
ncbi:hypothetical protein BKA70DRAFT_1237729 [Coprinopsis sp. MPI-PUGE-AT-0042]|nr:hypothetical protein BKA70DRAFT_1237729 [Coprinopsis sp. MPI-PUGE-AT-0042]